MRRLAGLGGFIGLGADAVYLYVVHTQQVTDDTLRVPFLAALIAAASLLALLAPLIPLRMLRQLVLSFAAASLLIIGVLALFSIGAILLIAGALIATAVVRPLLLPGPLRIAATVLGAVVALLVCIAGLQWSSYPVSCVGIGDGSGSSTAFLGNAFFWTCHGGRLTVTGG